MSEAFNKCSSSKDFDKESTHNAESDDGHKPNND